MDGHDLFASLRFEEDIRRWWEEKKARWNED